MKLLLTVAAALLIAQPATAKLRVFACEPEWASLVSELAPDAKIHSATNVYQDPHYIEARPGLIAKLRRADLLICSGASLETGWLPVLLRQAANPKVQRGQPGHLMAAMQVERLDVPTQIDRTMGDVHAEGNPHVHLDPRRIAQIADVLLTRLQAIDTANASQYAANHRQFSTRWQQAMAKWQQQAKPLRGKKLVTHHSEWAYLNDFLGTVTVTTLEPKPGIPPSISHLANLLATLKNEPVLAIVRKPADPKKASEWLAQRINRPALLLPYSTGPHDATNLFKLFDDMISQLLAANA